MHKEKRVVFEVRIFRALGNPLISWKTFDKPNKPKLNKGLLKMVLGDRRVSFLFADYSRIWPNTVESKEIVMYKI